MIEDKMVIVVAIVFIPIVAAMVDVQRIVIEHTLTEGVWALLIFILLLFVCVGCLPWGIAIENIKREREGDRRAQQDPDNTERVV
jgi:Na+-transporting NADH:ubiquinone oxidoreductase subunit NqrE